MGEVTITIAGRGYRMACADGEEERLGELGRALDGRVAMLRRALGELGDMRLLVMAGVTLCDEMEEIARENEQLKAEIAGRGAAESAADARLIEREEKAAIAVDQVAERLESLAREIGQENRAP